MSTSLPTYGPPTLQGTLQGGLASAEEEQARLMQEAAARAASLSQGAGEAQGAFQQAAEAPMPDLNPMMALIRSMGGNIGSIIGETPRYAQNAQADLNAQKDELLAKRAQNLAALKDNYDRQAAAAQSAGDLLAEAKLRKSAESVSKAWQAIHDESAFRQQTDRQTQKEKADASEGALDRASREKIAGLARQSAAANGGLGADFDPTLYIEETPVIDLASGEQRGGRKYINTSSAAIPNLKLRQVITDYARKNKIPIISTTKQQQALGLIQDARENTAGVYSRIAPILAQEGGWARAKNSMMNAAAGAFQLGERGTIVSGYKAYRTAAIASIQAIATLGPGLRINQAEINAAMKYDIPTEFDTDAVALEKISVFNEMLDHAEKTLLGEVVDQKDVRRVIQRSAELGKAKPPGPGKPVDDGWSPPDERVPVGAHSRAPRSR